MESKTKGLKVKRVISALDYDSYEQPATVYPKPTVDSSQYEDLATIVAKYQRGEPVFAHARVGDSYLPEGTDPEQAINEIDVLRRPGSDLADASEALQRGREELDEVQKKSKNKKPEKKDEPKKEDDVNKDGKKEPVAPDAPPAKEGATAG